MCDVWYSIWSPIAGPEKTLRFGPTATRKKSYDRSGVVLCWRVFRLASLTGSLFNRRSYVTPAHHARTHTPNNVWSRGNCAQRVSSVGMDVMHNGNAVLLNTNASIGWGIWRRYRRSGGRPMSTPPPSSSSTTRPSRTQKEPSKER